MRLAPRLLPAGLAIALLGASLVPCTPEGSGAGAPLALATQAAAEHPPDCHRVEATQLEAPCPCGCSQRAGGSVTARLGLALLSEVAGVAAGPALPAVLPARLHAPEAPPLAIDHVPLDV